MCGVKMCVGFGGPNPIGLRRGKTTSYYFVSGLLFVKCAKKRSPSTSSEDTLSPLISVVTNK